MAKAIKTPVEFLEALRETEMTWIVTRGDASLFDAVFEGEHVQLRLVDFPDAPLYTISFRREEFDLEATPDIWHLQD
jgi:hypothetical protein